METVEQMIAAVAAWNTFETTHPKTKSKRKKKPIDTLAIVRRFEKPLPVWGRFDRKKLAQELAREEARKRAEMLGLKEDDA